MATTNGNKSDWLTLLQAANSTRCDKIPAGYKPTEAWANELGITPGTWRLNAAALELAGVMDRKEFRAQIGKRLMKRPYWKRL